MACASRNTRHLFRIISERKPCEGYRKPALAMIPAVPQASKPIGCDWRGLGTGCMSRLHEGRAYTSTAARRSRQFAVAGTLGVLTCHAGKLYIASTDPKRFARSSIIAGATVHCWTSRREKTRVRGDEGKRKNAQAKPNGERDETKEHVCVA